MKKEEIMDTLIKILKDDIELEIPACVMDETTLDELGLDSISMMSLWVYAEEHFSYETDEDALVGDQFITIGDIAEYIEKKIN